MKTTVCGSKLLRLTNFTILGCWIAAVVFWSAGNLHAEGSKELCANGGYRPWMMYRTDTSDGSPITNLTVILAYAQVGETINLGSSVRTNANIIWYAPDGVIGTNNIAGGVGIISNRTQEVAGPLPNPGGYNPRTITVTNGQAGVWEIHFRSPNPASADSPTAILATNNWVQPTTGGNVAAWDVTVRSGGGSAIPGRVYANLISMNMGTWVAGGTLRSQVYYLTSDGYRYRINLNSLDPFRFQFFANNRGFRDGSGAPLFKSVNLAGASVHNPLLPDTATDITHKLFFNPPASDLPASAATRWGTTWLNSTPVTVITSNILFIGVDGTTNQVGSALGGYFTFDASGPGSYIINIDLNGDAAYTSAVDRVLLGTAYAGANTVFWDGRDGQGNPAPGGQSIFNSRIAVANGEVHFPFADAEGCYSGIVIERLNGPTNDVFTIYWDDTDFSGGTSALPPNGSNSMAGAHSWLPSGASGFGNARGIDTWVFVPGDFEQPSSPIAIKQTDLEVVSQTRVPTFVKPATNVTYTIVIRNNGPDNTPQARLLNIFPPGLTNLTLLSANFTGSAGISSGAFTNNTYDARIQMNVGEVGTLTFQGTVAAGLGSVLTNIARFLTYNDVGDVNDPDRVGAGNNGSTNIVAVTFTVTGTVYHDLNLNAALDTGETGTGLSSLYAKLIHTNTPTTAVSAALVDPTSGAYTLTTTQTGGHLVILDDNATLSDVTPALPAGWLGTEAVGQRRTGITIIGDVSDINFGLYNGSYLLLSATANPTVRTSAGSSTFSVIVTNTSSISNALTTIVANLASVPATASYVAGTSFYNGSAIGNPTISGTTNLTWTGTFHLPAYGVGTLTFAATFPATLGVYTNRVFARVSDTQIDTTASTADNAPAIATVRRATTNSVPTVQNVSVSVPQGSNVVVNPSAFDADDDPLTVFIVTPPTHGIVNVNPNLTFTYTPTGNYYGPDSFTYRASDGTTNSALGTASITVLDVTPPVITQCATNQLGAANASCQAAVPNFTNNVVATDNSSPAPVITQNPTIGSLVGLGTNTVLLIATDGSGNTATCSVAFVVRDLTAPAISAFATNLTATADANCQAAVPNFTNSVVAADNCSGLLTITQTPNIGTLAGLGTNAVTLQVVDAAGNTNTAAAAFIVSDTTPPTITTCATNQFASADGSGNAAVPDFTAGVAATDNCSAVSLSQSPLLGTLVGLGAHPITIYAVDAAGNTNSTCTATFTVQDTTAPTITTCATNQTAVADAGCQAVVPSFTNGVVATDNSGGTPVLTQVPVIGSVAGLGTNTILVIATDGAGNAATCTASFVVLDLTPPSITGYTTNLTASAGGSCSAPVPDFAGSVVATDNCSSPVGITQTPTAGAPASVGTNTVTLHVFDDSGNSNTVAATFVVTDSTPPTITCPAPVLVVAGPGASVVSNVNLGTPVTSDNCGVGAVTNDAPVAFPLGETLVVWTVTDVHGNSATCTQTVNVLTINHPPVAVPDVYTNNQNAVLSVGAPGLLANDSDPDGDAIFAVLVAPPTNGLVTVNADGSFSYTPNLNFIGTDAFQYKVSDGELSSSNALITIVVVPVNQPALANPDSFSTPANTPLTVAAPGVLANDMDSDGDPLTAVLVADVAHGTLTLNPDGSFTYTPDAGYIGLDSFTYIANDGTADSAPTVVTLAVGLGDVPVANPDGYTLDQNQSLIVPAGTGVLANDVSGNPLTAFLLSGPYHGTLTFNPDGSFNYTPFPNFSGTDNFVYRATDGALVSSAAIVTLTVNAVNQPPVANADSYSATPDDILTVDSVTGVLANDYDPEGAPVTAALVDDVANGVLVFNADGSFAYTPDTGFVGTDGFTYYATDGVTNSGPVLVTIYVDAGNRVPVANNDSYGVNKNDTLTISAPGVLANDFDDDVDPLTAILVADVAHGTLTFNADGSFEYVPDTGFTGADSFTYRLNDGTADSGVATVFITVQNVILTPTVQSSTPTMPSGGTLNMPAPGALTGATAPNGPPLTAILVSNVTHGVLVLNPDGSYSYTPAPDFLGVDCFYFAGTDGLATSSVASVCITVEDATPPMIVACADDQTLDANGSCEASLPNLTGTLTVTDNSGSFTITQTPVPGTTLPLGSNTVTFVAADAAGNSSTCTAVVVVRDVTPPVITLTGDSTITIACQGSFTDPGATASDNCAGNLTGSMVVTGAVNTAAVGTYTLHYHVTDPAGNPATPVTRTVNVVDTTPPVITCPGNMVVTAPAGTNAVSGLSLGSPGASDGCGTVTVTNNAPASFPIGDTVVTWTADDGHGNTATCEQLVTVLPGNTAPVAGDGSFDAPQDGQLEVGAPGVLQFASDADGDSLTAITVTDPAHGTLTLWPDGSFVYVPNPGFSGTDTFTYAVSDGVAVSTPATITLYVSASGWVSDLQLLAASVKFKKNWAEPNRDRIRIVGRVNPRGARANLAGTTFLVTMNGHDMTAPIVLDAKGRAQLKIGATRIRVFLSSVNGRYKFYVRNTDLTDELNLSPGSGAGLVNLDIVLSLQGGDFDVPVLGGIFETPYTTTAGVMSKARFKFKAHRTLTGVFNSNKTIAKLGKAGGYSLGYRGAIENIMDVPIVPTGPVRIQVGGNVMGIPAGAVNGKVKVPGLRSFRLNTLRHTFRLKTTELDATGIPLPGAGAETSVRVPLTIEVPNGAETNRFETIIELKRPTPFGKAWKR